MKYSKIDKLYNHTIKFCLKSGLIKDLKNSLVKSEGERFDSIDIQKTGLSVLDAVHCLYDRKRTYLLLDEIKRCVKSNDTVLEAGLGTGILSFYSSLLSKRVYAYEINHDIYDLYTNIKNYLLLHGYTFDNLISVRSNAKSFNQRKGADVIISENIYTGMFFEKQIDIVKSLRGNLKKGGTIIPSGMKSYIALCSIKTKNKKDKFLVLNEINEKPLIFTDRGAYDLIDFLKIKRRAVSKKINLPVLKDGVADSVIISSDVLLHSGNIIGSLDTDFMNNDVIIKLGRKLILKAGEVVSIKVTYTYGSSPLRAKFVVKRI